MNQDALREHVFLWCFLGGQRNIKEWSRPTYKAYMVPHRNYNEGFPSQVVYLPGFIDKTSGLENFIFMPVSQGRKVNKFFWLCWAFVIPHLMHGKLFEYSATLLPICT